MPSLDSITFDTSSLRPGRPERGRRLWTTPDGDAVELLFFDRPPDLPPGLDSLESLKQFYRSLSHGSPDALVELDLLDVGGCRAIRTIIKGRQQPQGTRYMGSLSLPFRDFNFVIKVQCQEQNPTGLRETGILERLVGESKVRVDPASGQIVGEWNPDDPQYDAEFPTHPLSRLRAWLRRIAESCVVDPFTSALPPFPLP